MSWILRSGDRTWSGDSTPLTDVQIVRTVNIAEGHVLDDVDFVLDYGIVRIWRADGRVRIRTLAEGDHGRGIDFDLPEARFDRLILHRTRMLEPGGSTFDLRHVCGLVLVDGVRYEISWPGDRPSQILIRQRKST